MIKLRIKYDTLDPDDHKIDLSKGVGQFASQTNAGQMHLLHASFLQRYIG